jgi:hypothetical protein
MRYARFLVSIAAVCTVVIVHVPAVSADEIGAGEEIVVPLPEPPKEEPKPKPKPKMDYRGLYGGPGVGVADHSGRSEAAWRMDVWLRAHNYFGLGIGYADLGDGGGGDRDGLTIAGMPTIPIAEIFHLYGGVGTIIGTFNDTTEVELTYGGGASVDLPFRLGLGAEYLHYNLPGKDVDGYWLKLFYKFGGFK